MSAKYMNVDGNCAMCFGINWNLCTSYAPVRLSSYKTEKVKGTFKKMSCLYYV